MPKIEHKIINRKLFFYISEQIRLKNRYKKIQVYIGKNIPKSLVPFLKRLEEKEIALVASHIRSFFLPSGVFTLQKLLEIETLRIQWKYFIFRYTQSQRDRFWRRFAIQFIFESNAIEGSRLSQKEVAAIIQRHYVKKSLDRKEVREVKNALRAFDFIRKDFFRFNQRSIIQLHALLTKNLEIPYGYKKSEIIVNNKKTTPPGKVRKALADLLYWYFSQKKFIHPLLLAADFHQRFEKIHPFEDGNGRIGRLLFIWMMLQADYPVLFFLYSKRQSYFNALDQADEGRSRKWHRLCVDIYKRTTRGFLRSSTDLL